MKTKLLGGVALALILGVSSAAYANPKNTFSNGNFTVVESTAVAASTGNINVYSGNGGEGGNGGDVESGKKHGGGNSMLGFGKGDDGAEGGDGGKGGDGYVRNGDSVSVSSAVSESFNKNNEGVSKQTLIGVSAINVQLAIAGGLNKISNDGATAKNIDTSGITSAAAAAGNGSLNVQGVSVGAGADVSFD